MSADVNGRSVKNRVMRPREARVQLVNGFCALRDSLGKDYTYNQFIYYKDNSGLPNQQMFSKHKLSDHII